MTELFAGISDLDSTTIVLISIAGGAVAGGIMSLLLLLPLLSLRVVQGLLKQDKVKSIVIPADEPDGVITVPVAPVAARRESAPPVLPSVAARNRKLDFKPKTAVLVDLKPKPEAITPAEEEDVSEPVAASPSHSSLSIRRRMEDIVRRAGGARTLPAEPPVDIAPLSPRKEPRRKVFGIRFRKNGKSG